jgi:hypothetical protein
MAKRIGNQLELRDRVTNREDLPGVPAGTPGRVILVDGLPSGDSWRRYRVWFDTGVTNGTDIGSLDASQLVRIDRSGNVVSVTGEKS